MITGLAWWLFRLTGHPIFLRWLPTTAEPVRQPV